MVELLVALDAVVDGACPVCALVRQQLGFGLEHGVALEAGQRPDGSGRGPILREAGLFVSAARLSLFEHGCR